MEREAEVALELLIQLCMKLAVRIKPRDFVFILIGHQFEQGARRSFGETVLAGRFDRFGRPDAVERGTVAFRISRVLIVLEKRHPPRHDLVECLGKFWTFRSVKPGQLEDRSPVMCRKASQTERALVRFHRSEDYTSALQ